MAPAASSQVLVVEIPLDAITAGSAYDYGLWQTVTVYSLIFIVFAFSFARPKSNRDWRSFGAFSAFIAALFTEMYGFPLTIYLLSGWLTSNYPDLNIFSHGAGHLWQTLFGGQGNPHISAMHGSSNILIFGGLILLSWAWLILYRAQRSHSLATTGPYAYVRHPQYLAFILVMLGFLLQWPTIPTLLMFPILVWMYVRLAHFEERQTLTAFGDEYTHYSKVVPGFIPRLGIAARSWSKQP
ncbi:MAG: isoprenylcysteine carboxylmethyltransferase family protein [Mariprofundaceae bacterium]